MRTTSIPGREQLMAERRRLRRRYKDLYGEMTRILFERDPIGIAHALDEYEPEVGRILARTDSVRSVEELTDAIHAVFIEMFDASIAGPRAKYQAIAVELWKLIHGPEACA